MRRWIVPSLAIVLLALPGASANATHPVAASRVVVSMTLNNTLQVFDALTLEQTQPPLPSKGPGPVRLWYERLGGKPFLFSANHGAGVGSAGVFDVSGPVLELPASPFPARAGSVGVVAGTLAGGGERVMVTNTWFALGGCGMPTGSVTTYDASLLATAGVMRELSTIDVSGAIPYAVAFDGNARRGYVSSNCADSLDTIDFGPADVCELPCVRSGPTKGAKRAAGDGADGAIVDPATGLVYVANIGGNSVSVFDPDSPEARTTVALPGARPIDINLANGGGGGRWVVTSNGGDDSVSLVDRGLVEACVAAGLSSCSAEVARIKTGVAGGAPEGVAFDPATNRIFSVNKGLMAPSLSVIFVDESGATPTGSVVGTIPLQAAGPGTPVPSVIAFDVEVIPADGLTPH